MKFPLFIFFLTFFSLIETFAQVPPEQIKRYVQTIESGKAAGVRPQIAQMRTRYPNDEGVIFLEACANENQLRALGVYKAIIRKNPPSEWADDAQWQLVRYYVLKRDTARSRAELQNLRTKFPRSEFIRTAEISVRNSVGLPNEIPPSIVTKSEVLKQPEKGEVLKAPEKRDVIKPEKSEVLKPEKKEILKAEKTEVLKSQKTEVLKQEKTEIIKPKKTEVLKSDKTEISKPERPEILKEEIAGEPVEIKPSRYAIQVAVYSDREVALLEAHRFKNKRMRAAMLTKEIDGETKYTVVIGDYSSRESAEKAQPIVQSQCECAPFIVER
jgi:hypothetical protein